MTSTISTRTAARRARRMSLALTPVAAVALLLTACGGSASGDGGGSGGAAASTTGPTTSPGAGGQDGRRNGGGFARMDFQKIQQCLDAAGLDLTLPTFDPNNRPSGMPRRSFDPDRTARPGPPADGTRPSGAPGEGWRRGQGDQGGPGGPFRELFTDPDVQAALEACGIELPRFPQGSPSPSR